MVRFIIPYFGRLPEWIDLFFLSCEANPGFEWLIITDDESAGTPASNVEIRHSDFHGYRELVSHRLGVDFRSAAPYKLCDLKPFLGLIHEEDLADADFWGFTDLDLLYGDLGRFYPPELLARYDVISSMYDRMAGHLGMIRNTAQLSQLCTTIPRWQERLVAEEHQFLDEADFYFLAFTPLRRLGGAVGKLVMLLAERVGYYPWLTGRVYAKNMHTTPIIPLKWHDGTTGFEQPLEWEWNSGRIHSLRDGYEAPYLHFMNYKSAKYLPAGTPPWEGLTPLIDRAFPTDTKPGKIRIGVEGIRAE